MSELRKKIVRLPCSLDIDQVNEVCKATVTWFQQAIEGLKPLSDEELGEIIRQNQTGRPFKNESGIAGDSSQATVEDIKRQLFEKLEGK